MTKVSSTRGGNACTGKIDALRSTAPHTSVLFTVQHCWKCEDSSKRRGKENEEPHGGGTACRAVVVALCGLPSR
eukprot:scaffold77662_cov47-Phaeocystis_antarctica.AAC.3